jgi:hypothetical protein
MTIQDICTIEINLNEDFANSCAYHIDYLNQTILRNIAAAEREKTEHPKDAWVLVGLAHTLSEANDKCAELQKLLCQRNNKKPYGIAELLEKMGEQS